MNNTTKALSILFISLALIWALPIWHLAEGSGTGALQSLMTAIIASLIFIAVFAWMWTTFVTPIAAIKKTCDAIKDGTTDDLDSKGMKGEMGEIVSAAMATAKGLGNLSKELHLASDQIKAGKLTTHVETKDMEGVFKELAGSINHMLDSIMFYLEMVPMPIMTIDKSFNILFLNKAGTSLGKTTFSQLAGTKCYDFFKTGECNTENCACSQAMRTKARADSSTDAHPGELDLFIDYLAVPVNDDQGQCVGALEIVVDQTKVVLANNKMREAASQAEEVSQRLSSATEELTVQIEQAGRGAENQKMRTDETATAMEQMNATVLEVASNASNAAEHAEETRSMAGHGAKNVGKMVESIHKIDETAQNLKANMDKLGAQAESIGEVMNVISDIADQTNLLALNAAIEAARAGEAGRGFAVVADEVRKLAEKTMEATKKVGEAISSIQDGIRNNMAEADQASQIVGHSTGIAEESGQDLQRILDLAEKTSDQVRAIATASEEQSAASEQVARSTGEINSISNETSMAMDESERAVMELAELARNLETIIGELTRA